MKSGDDEKLRRSEESAERLSRLRLRRRPARRKRPSADGPMKPGDAVRIECLRTGAISEPTTIEKITANNVIVNLGNLDHVEWGFGWKTKRFNLSDLHEWRHKREPRFRLAIKDGERCPMCGGDGHPHGGPECPLCGS